MELQKLKCYVLGPKSQKFPTAENTRYTVYVFKGVATKNIELHKYFLFSREYMVL